MVFKQSLLAAAEPGMTQQRGMDRQNSDCEKLETAGTFTFAKSDLG